jgi:hypothetical protein
MAQIFRRFTKTFVGLDNLDSSIREFFADGSVLMVNLLHTGGDAVVAVYEETQATLIDEKEARAPKVIEQSVRASEPIPEVDDLSKIESPLVQAFIRTSPEADRKAIKVMAGQFAVPEGEAYSVEDDVPAPKVLISKKADLSRYEGLIFNTEKTDGREKVGK